MPDQPRKDQDPQQPDHEASPQVVDAIRHVGRTLESEGTFLPSGELPENRIENEGMTDTADMRATEDEYDREADAMGAEPLHTRLPGDTSSDPHTDADGESGRVVRRNRKKDHAA